MCTHYVLFVMVRTIIKNGHSPVQLLYEDEAYHLMCENVIFDSEIFSCAAAYTDGANP